MRYFIELSFKGTQYHGWQSQPNASSVQQHIENALSITTRKTIKITGSGRTDSGVHAKLYIAHFDDNETVYNEDIIYHLNAILPADIVVHKIYQVRSDVHARYSALSRTYKYFISRTKDPFTIDFSWQHTVPLNIDLMNSAALILKDYNDFTSFSKLHTDVKTNICKIYEAEWKEDNNQLIFTISADRFLRNMVRSIVGTIIDVGKEKISLNNFREIIEAKNRNKAGFSVPPQGLILYNISYDDNLGLI